LLWHPNLAVTCSWSCAAKEALDAFREEFPGQPLTGTMVNIQKASFDIRQQQVSRSILSKGALQMTSLISTHAL
jgi:hypothetical protein